MYLKRMEMLGFKSFPTKTKISFEPGIACIVGPNGSGKSNVVDALRWVLGEQNSRTLRGGKIEDVIFSGSKNRRPLGMAEVSLIIDNSDNTLPVDYTEIELTRRNFRGGGSEYLINNRPCRLKDIQELLVDSGVSTAGISLINQGRINELISVSAFERREIVEEAAGVVKYRNRKKEAQRKLAESERHLERVSDIVNELTSRIGPLQEQAQKAEHYLILKEEADALEIGLSVKVLKEAHAKMAQFNQDIQAAEEKILIMDTERLTKSALAEELRLQITALDEQLQKDSQEYYQLLSQKEKTEGELNLARSRKQNAEDKRLRLENELAEILSLSKKKEEDITDLTGHCQRTQEEISALERDIAQGYGGEQDRREATEYLSEKLSQMKDEAFSLAKELADLRNKLSLQEQLKEKNNQRRNKIEELISHLAYEITDAKQKTQDISAKRAELNKEIKQRLAVGQKLDKQLAEIVQQLQDLVAEELELKYQANSLRTRVTMLKDITSSYEGYFPGVRELLTAKHKDKLHDGVIDAVANLIEVPDKFTCAIETYLGSALQDVVTETAEAARKSIDWLKKHEAGRATFLPLDQLKVRRRPDLAPLKGLEGVFGLASQLVACPKGMEVVRDFLLNGLVIAQDVNIAMKSAKLLNYSVSVVTLDGDLIHPGASMSGGSRRKKSLDLLGKKNQLEHSQKELADTEERLNRLSLQIGELRCEEAKINDSLQENVDFISELSASDQSLANGAELASSSEANLQRQQTDLLHEREDIDGELFSIDDECQILLENYHKLEIDNDKLLTDMEIIKTDLTEKQTKLDESREGTSRRREKLAGLKQKLHGQQLSLAKLQEERENLSWDAEDKNSQLQIAALEADKEIGQIAGIEELLLKLNHGLLTENEALEQQRHFVTAENARLMELDKTNNALINQIAQVKDDLHRQEIRRERWESDLRHEERKLREQFEMGFEEAVLRSRDGESRTAMNQRLGVLRREIRGLGSVNIGAIEEYREVDERYTFLGSQQQDLLSAIDQLNSVIAEMDSIMSSRFRKAYHALSTEFGVSFKRLFGGGEASLVLTDPDNILETGVEIAVQPPGKKVTNHNLLSGGEKSMVGIALMFAMLEVRPTPFCVMDEVDAALDEANIDRFTSFLQEKAHEGQFVMITHRQSTMEAASALWGITMEEEGVSKVVSVRLNETGVSA